MPITTRERTNNIYELPSYGIAEAAHYLGIPVATLRSWALGRPYPAKGQNKFFNPIILPPTSQRIHQLSFMNLVEAHVLNAIRRHHKVLLSKVRKAIAYLRDQYPSKHPLADQKFETDGMDLFIDKYGTLINISQDGQLAVRQLLERYLSRVERDPHGIPIKLYPFIRKGIPDEPKNIVIDPAICFGRPVLAGTGIATLIIAERYKAGETIDELAEDYAHPKLQIEDAIRCELQLEAA